MVIVGAGNLGRLLLDCLEGDDRWRPVAFIDDGLAGGRYLDLPIFGAEDYDCALTRNAFLAIGYPEQRQAMLARVAPLGLAWNTFVDRRSVVGRGVELGEGVLILSFAVIASGVRVGDFCYISAYASAGAGASIGAFTSVLPGALVGSSHVGEHCVLGVHSACLDGATIGDGAVVSPHALVRKSVPPGALVAGSAARIVGRSEGAVQAHGSPKTVADSRTAQD